jgi:hypothetical protein
MHRCTIYGLTGPGSKLVVEVPAVIAEPEPPKPKALRRHIEPLATKTKNGVRLTLR